MKNRPNNSLAILSYKKVNIPFVSKLLEQPHWLTSSSDRGLLSSVYSLRKLEAHQEVATVAVGFSSCDPQAATSEPKILCHKKVPYSNRCPSSRHFVSLSKYTVVPQSLQSRQGKLGKSGQKTPEKLCPGAVTGLKTGWSWKKSVKDGPFRSIGLLSTSDYVHLQIMSLFQSSKMLVYSFVHGNGITMHWDLNNVGGNSILSTAHQLVGSNQ